MADPRRAEILEAATAVFLRYGFKKTSMDEVARAAGMSRPGLYLHFPGKLELFTATVDHLIEGMLAKAQVPLNDASLSLEDRLLAAFVAFHGSAIGAGHFASHQGELMEAAMSLQPNPVEASEARFRALLVDAIAHSACEDVTTIDGIPLPAFVELLTTLSMGVKHHIHTIEGYTETLQRLLHVLLTRNSA